MVGSAAVRTDNEEQTFVGLGAEAVGGPCLEAITAGGSTQAGKKTAKEGVGEGNKDLQIKVVDTFKKKKKKNIAYKRLMRTRNNWMSVTLCI